nr:MAG TPA_asm: adenine-specific methyltransferase [Caudoviricetes sp.]
MKHADWTGNGNSIYKTLGASNHTENERETYDYYATEPKAAELLCEVESLSPAIWECACGEGHLAEVLRKRGHIVKTTDLIDRGYGCGGVDFLKENVHFQGDIVTNPPYKYAKEFVEHAIDTVADGCKVCMFLKLQFLEGKARRALFEKYPPKCVYIASGRLLCAKNGDFEKMKAGGGSAVAYAWFVWQKGYTGETVIRWIN